MKKKYFWKRLIVVVLVLSMGASLSYTPFYAEAQETEGEEGWENRAVPNSLSPLNGILPMQAGDNTAPKIKYASLIETDISAPGVLKMNIEIEEETEVSGITLFVEFQLSNGIVGNAQLTCTDWIMDRTEPLAIGNHVVEFTATHLAEADYNIIWIMIQDSSSNVTTYKRDSECGEGLDAMRMYNSELPNDTLETDSFVFANRKFHVTNSQNGDLTPPRIKSASLKQGVVNAPGILEMTMDIEDDTGVADIQLIMDFPLSNGVQGKKTIVWTTWGGGNQLLTTGIHTVKFDIPETFAESDYNIASIVITDKSWNTTAYSLGSAYSENYALGKMYNTAFGFGVDIDSFLLQNGDFHVSNLFFTDLTPPKIKSASISKKEIDVPGMLELNLEVEEEIGVYCITLSIEYDKPNGARGRKRLDWSSYHHNGNQPLTSGKHTLNFPMNITHASGDYEIVSIEIRDTLEYSTFYYKGSVLDSNLDSEKMYNLALVRDPLLNSEEDTFSFDRTYTAKNDLNIELDTTIDDNTLVDQIENLSEDGVAVVDYGNSGEAPEELFHVIEGTDRKIIFQKGDFQWLSEGKKIEKSKIKKIDLNVQKNQAPGDSLGFSDDTVTELSFPDNGELPGEVEIRVNDENMLAKHKAGKDIYATWMENGKPQGKTQKVQVAGDNYLTFKIGHNSTYVLSTNYPDIIFEGEWKKGDINNDGKINIQDIMEIRNHIFGKVALEGDTFLAADIDGDGVVNIRDIMAIRDHIFGKKVIS